MVMREKDILMTRKEKMLAENGREGETFLQLITRARYIDIAVLQVIHTIHRITAHYCEVLNSLFAVRAYSI